MSNEIMKGCGLIHPEESALNILGLEINPVGAAEHPEINSLGDYVSKQRVTYDLSFPGVRMGESIISRMDRLELEHIMFGHCMSRLMHQLVTLRRRHPGRKIWTRKKDLKSAYRRLRLRAGPALKSGMRVKINGK